ncbi:hypothetical protein WL68_19675 [Burkholderia cepacia]|nr:hypothetical protein WL06_36755 [Burkholderia cepacia]KWD62423.1 hypothetical protein WL68_19675 [Burkholderia cepacia]KWD74751.1 hypothetical protein WL69_29280 [Burkholderia cepacia]
MSASARRRGRWPAAVARLEPHVEFNTDRRHVTRNVPGRVNHMTPHRRANAPVPGSGVTRADEQHGAA